MKAYRDVLIKTVDQRVFGIGMPGDNGKDEPRFVNGKDNPRPLVHPNRDSVGYHREESVLSPWVARRHLMGVRACFNVARADRREVELCIDIDGDKAHQGPRPPLGVIEAWARECFHTVLPGVEPFIEPSRSFPAPSGVYVRFRMRWPKRTAASVRRAVELILNAHFYAAYQAHPLPGVKYDGLKGTTRYRTPNPK